MRRSDDDGFDVASLPKKPLKLGTFPDEDSNVKGVKKGSDAITGVSPCYSLKKCLLK